MTFLSATRPPRPWRLPRECCTPLVARLAIEGSAVAAAEVRRRRKAAGDRDVENRLRRLEQEAARPLESQLQIVAAGAHAQVACEQALELPRRQVDLCCNRLHRQRIVAGLL